MSRLHTNSRIRPVRPYWSRAKLLTVLALSAVASFWAATAWFHRAEVRTVDLAPSGPQRFVSAAGPIAVSRGDPPLLEYRASWFLKGPTEKELTPGLRLSCETAMPCRAASELKLPAGADLRIEAEDNDVSVDLFDGDLTIEVDGAGEVFLGPIGGVVEISTGTGGVFGYGLTVQEMEIDTAGGPIDLRFAERPKRLIIRSGGEPVTIELPDGDYAVSVKSASSTVIAVGQAQDADSEILVQARGPVRINKPEQ